jgi:hypothetical protein
VLNNEREIQSIPANREYSSISNIVGSHFVFQVEMTMNMTVVFAVGGGIALLFYIVSSIQIVRFLEKRGVKINYWLIRVTIIKYAHQYKKITRAETGAVGRPFLTWIYSLWSMLGCAVGAIISHAAGR